MDPAYAYVELSRYDLGLLRLGGPGLGNLLFPWARAVVACGRHGLVPLATTWPQVKLGPLLRRERDLRSYVGIFRRAPAELGGLRRALVLLRAERLGEERLGQPGVATGRPRMFVFRGMDQLFAPIREQHDLVRSSLLAITRPAHRPPPPVEPFLAVHVRLGDFAPADEARTRKGDWSHRVDLAWYAEAITRLRRVVPSVRVELFSDGSDAELARLLALPGVVRAVETSAMASLWRMSQAAGLVASGSSFSMWAGYLGRMPVVWPVGQLRLPLHDDAHTEVEFDGRAPWAAGFDERVRASVRPRQG